MCIICNCGDDGDVFLMEFELARDKMKAAKEAMLKCSHSGADPVVRARYDATHKKMVRLLREWNSLEEDREKDHIADAGKKVETPKD